MSSHPLSNYVRTHRKRVGFSQDEVAFLLGAMSGSKTCRYERRNRLPPLKTALALEVIFRTPIRELFPGVFWEAEKEVVERAKGLVHSLIKKPESRITTRKVEALQRMIAVQQP